MEQASAKAWAFGDETEMGLRGWASLPRAHLLPGSLLSPPRAVLVLCNMSLQAWDWEEEERASTVVSAFHSGSECEVEDYLKCRHPAHEWDYEDQFSCSLHSSEGPASDVPQIVPCRFVISLAFPILIGRC